MTKVDLNSIKDPLPTFIETLSSGENINVRIQTNNDNLLIKSNKKNESLRIEYDFDKKNFNLPKFEKFFYLFSNKRSPDFPTQEQKYILSKLKHVPIYTVVNKNNEIITASSRETKPYNSLKWIQNKYNELFTWTHDEGSISISLFFMNKEDASSYLHEICKREPRDSESSGLSIKTVGLDLFYKLNRTSAPKTQTRLVADLKEIDLLLNKYLKNCLCTINPKQKYSSRSFQGNPVYIIKFHKNKLEKSISEYSLPNKDEEKVIFFSREDASRAWKLYTSKNSKSLLNTEPNVEIYNLESLLLDMESSGLKDVSKITLVPPYNSYKNLKESQTQKISTRYSKLHQYLFTSKLKLKNLERFYRGVVWLFTSDTLPSEENSW
jgi:hypothetical protein